MPDIYTNQSDNTRVQRPIVQQFIRSNATRIPTAEQQLMNQPTIRQADEVNQITAQERRNNYEREYQRIIRDQNNQKTLQFINDFLAFYTPSTHIAAIADDQSYMDAMAEAKGFDDPLINLAVDAGTGLATAIGKTVGKNVIKNINTYYFPKTKLYSDNPIINAYATFARRYDLPDKARLPYLIRRIHSKDLNFDEQGNLILTGNRWDHANFTYDLPVMPHGSGSWDNAPQTLLINPRNFVEKQEWGSIEPSDMFNIKNTPHISYNDVINITSNPTAKRLSKKYNIQTVSNKHLKQQELNQLKSEQKEYLNNYNKVLKLDENERRNINPDYYNAVLEEINKFGRPKIKDIRLLEEVTGLNSYIHPIKDIKRFKDINPKELRKMNIDAYMKEINNLPKFNNGRTFNIERQYDYNNIRKPYRNFFYDPVTQAESDFTFK